RRGVGTFVDVDTEDALGIDRGRSRKTAMDAQQRHGVAMAAELDTFDDLGDDTDLRVGAIAPRDEEHAAVRPDIDRKGDRHAGENDRVVEWDDSQSGHVAQLTAIS